MKKVLALIIAAMMIVSMIPVMAITTSAADVAGMWTTWRGASSYDEPEAGEEVEPPTPAPGYEYTNEGFHMISPDYSNCTPFGTIQTIDKVSIQDGVYMEIRIDDFSYGGKEEGAANNGYGAADNWIGFSIWDSQKIQPGDTAHGQGWVGLTRHRATIEVESFVSNDVTFAGGHKTPNSVITPELDENGKEIYTFEIAFDGTNYTISICGVPVAGGTDISKHLNTLDPNGEFYIGVTFHSGVAGGVAEATILKYGTSEDDATVPQGTDSKEPEINERVVAEIADSSTVPAGQPALLFDANETSWNGKIATQDMELEAQGNGSFKILPSNPVGFHMWRIGTDYSYEAQDFPVIAVLIEDPNEIFEKCTLRYSAGKNMSADDVHILDFSIYDENYEGNVSYYGEDEEFTLMVIDLKALLDEASFAEGWSGRIHSLRFDYQGLYLSSPVDPEMDYFFMHYAGIFRSVEDAQAYTNEYMGSEPTTEEDTEAPTEPEVTEPETDDEPVGSEENTVAETDPTVGTNDGANTDAETKAEEKKGGCGSVIASAAVLLSAAAAAVVLKKRD